MPPLPERRLRALGVFCGSSAWADPAFRRDAVTLGKARAAHSAALVFGGGHVGLMGAAADAVLADGGQIVGVIPQFLVDKELAHRRATEMIVVPDMHTRKRAMFDRSDAFCIMAGGVGTLDEMFEIVTWRQLHLHNKPIVVLNTAGYWSRLLAQLELISAEGFAHHGHDALVTVVDRAEDVIPTVERELLSPKQRVAFPPGSPAKLG